MPKKKSRVIAAFVLVRMPCGGIAATTRPKQPGAVGLPGGKLEKGETPYEAVMREAEEEGWKITGLSEDPIYIRHKNDEEDVYWYGAESAEMLTEFKDKHRLSPVIVSAEELVDTSHTPVEEIERLAGNAKDLP